MISQMGAPTPGGRRQHTIWSMFFQKLHENEETFFRGVRIPSTPPVLPLELIGNSTVKSSKIKTTLRAVFWFSLKKHYRGKGHSSFIMIRIFSDLVDLTDLEEDFYSLYCIC